VPTDYPKLSEEFQHRFQWLARWFKKDEVKTPLSFFFKVLPWLTGSWGLILYAPIPIAQKMHLAYLAASVFGGMFSLVAAFAWFKPRHLLYGEAGHRAERKLEFGTEKHTFTSTEIIQLPSTRNPQQLTGGEDPK
jgi:hypothetical protein